MSRVRVFSRELTPQACAECEGYDTPGVCEASCPYGNHSEKFLTWKRKQPKQWRRPAGKVTVRITLKDSMSGKLGQAIERTAELSRAIYEHKFAQLGTMQKLCLKRPPENSRIYLTIRAGKRSGHNPLDMFTAFDPGHPDGDRLGWTP